MFKNFKCRTLLGLLSINCATAVDVITLNGQPHELTSQPTVLSVAIPLLSQYLQLQHNLTFEITNKNIVIGSLEEPDILSKTRSVYDELNQNKDTLNKFNAAKDANLQMSGYYCAQTYSKIGGNFSAILGQDFWAADTIFEVGRDFTVTTPKVDVCGFFATVQGNTSFITPYDSTSWLRGVNIKPSYAFSRPFTYLMHGELDLDLAETKGRFLVVGAGEIEFIVQKPAIT